MWVLAILVIYLACISRTYGEFVIGLTYARIHAVAPATLSYAASLK